MGSAGAMGPQPMGAGGAAPGAAAGGGMMGMMGMAGMMGGGNMKPGDWMCPSCGDHQFAKNPACRKCGATKPEGAGDAGGGMGMMGGMMGGMGGGMKPGDWNCPQCGDHQFARNVTCRKCGAAKPAEARSAP